MFVAQFAQQIALWRFNLDDVGTLIGQHHRRDRTGHDHGQIQDANSVQRSVGPTGGPSGVGTLFPRDPEPEPPVSMGATVGALLEEEADDVAMAASGMVDIGESAEQSSSILLLFDFCASAMPS